MRILILSNSNSETNYGYSVVFSKVAKGLKEAGYEVFYFGMQTVRPPHKDKDGIVQLGLKADVFGKDILADYLRIYKIDLLITGLDLWLPQTYYISEVVKALKVPWIAHVTVNSSPLSPFLATNIKDADVLVAPSRFVEKELRNAGFQNVVYIPHGVDLSVFKPLPGVKEEMKKRLKIEDKEFVALSVMRNKGFQKCFPVLFHAWKIVKESYPDLKDAILLVLADPTEIEGMNLNLLRSRVNMEDNIKFVWAKPNQEGELEVTYEGDPKGMPHNANCNFSRQEMAKLYQVADVHISSSAGESFQLPLIEAAACGVPSIAPVHTATVELTLPDLVADVAAEVTTPLISDIFYVNPYSIAKNVHKLWKDKEFRKACSERVMLLAKNYDWNIILPKWVELVKQFEKPLPVNYQLGQLGI